MVLTEITSDFKKRKKKERKKKKCKHEWESQTVLPDVSALRSR